tara:strand:- start:257 stop:1114 length:858 start_codon:yes stop_codon:yes gene_type:complete
MGTQTSNVTQTTYTSRIPKALEPQATKLVGQAEALSDINQNPYVAYGGQEVAGYNPLQTQALEGISGLAPSAQIDQATGLAGLASQQNFTGANVGQYMSPYMQNVVDRQQQGAIRDYSRQLPGLASLSTQAGGLGGTRQALMQSEMQRGLQDRLYDIQATGQQSAYDNAQKQYNQYIQDQLASAGLLGRLGEMQFGQSAQALNMQDKAGKDLQGFEQRGLDVAKNNFKEQQRYPFEMLSWYNNILRGLPMSQTGSTVYQQTPSPSTLGQVANLGLGVGSLMGGGG